MKRIIWSVDAFCENPSQEKRALQVIGALTKGQRVSIEPVFILSDIHVGETDYHGDAKKILKKLVTGVKLPGLKRPQIVARVNPPFTVRKLVKGLLDEANERKADLIVAHTANRSGIARFVLGSFAETLALSSKKPLLLINPKAQRVRAINKILFATDFSSKSFAAYKKVVQQAAAVGASITLFHRVNYPQHRFKEGRVELVVDKKVIEKWSRLAESQSVEVKVSLDRKSKRVAKGILATAKRHKVELIAMSSDSGAISSIVMGSAAREVIRTAGRAVWIVR